jgi:hypothetical protein
MRAHAILTTIGLFAGLAALGWLQPDTAAGATFLVVICIVVVNAFGFMFSHASPLKTKRHRKLPVVWPIILALGASDPASAGVTPSPDTTVQPLKTRFSDHQTTGMSGTCFFTRGPRKGQTQATTAVPLGSRCTDTHGSIGSTIFDALSFERIPHRGVTLAPRSATEADALELQPARAFVKASEIPPPSIGAYGIVAFRAMPTTANRERLRRACQSFVAFLPREEALPAWVGLNDLMLTIWPLALPLAKEARTDNCDFALDHYDLFGGLSAIRDAEHQGASLDGRGPFLIGWSPSSTRGVPDKLVLIVDMSGFESQNSFDDAFQFWQVKVVQDPALWRTGFSGERLRLSLRDFVDRYGGDILDAIKLVTNK